MRSPWISIRRFIVVGAPCGGASARSRSRSLGSITCFLTFPPHEASWSSPHTVEAPRSIKRRDRGCCGVGIVVGGDVEGRAVVVRPVSRDDLHEKVLTRIQPSHFPAELLTRGGARRALMAHSSGAPASST